MTVKTKASRRLRLFKAKTSFLDVDSRVQLDDTGPAFYGTSFLDVVTQHRRGLTKGPLLFCNEVLRFTFLQMTEYQRCRPFFIPLLEERSRGGFRPPSRLFPLPRWRAARVTGTEGSQWRVWQPGIKPQQDSATDWRANGCTRRSVQAFIGPFPSHLSHKIGFVEALPSAEKAKVDYEGRRGWNGITSGMAPNITPCCLNANHDWIMNDLYSLLSVPAWLEQHTFPCHRPLKGHTVSTATYRVYNYIFIHHIMSLIE